MRGSYCIIIRVNEDSKLRIGSLGLINFTKGYYAYVGSAMNNIEKRIAHHKRKNKRTHWHIDYLTNEHDIIRAFYKESSVKEECLMAGLVGKHGTPIKGFGSSDCKCDSHLFRVSDYSFINDFMDEL